MLLKSLDQHFLCCNKRMGLWLWEHNGLHNEHWEARPGQLGGGGDGQHDFVWLWEHNGLHHGHWQAQQSVQKDRI